MGMDQKSTTEFRPGLQGANYAALDNWPPSAPVLLRGNEVFKRVALSRTTIWRRVREGTFPAPVSLGPTRIAWREADITAWVEAQRPAEGSPPGHRPLLAAVPQARVGAGRSS